MVELTYIFYTKLAIELVFFAIAFYSLQALNFEKFLRQGRVFQAQVLYVLLACALGHLGAQFFISMFYKLYIW